MIDERVKLYEQDALLEAAGETIRPGGLELTDYALSQCGLQAGAPVLDAGCGQAASVRHLIARHGLAAVGLDPSAVLLRAGRRLDPALALVQSSGERLPFATGSFAALLTECSLSVMKDSDRALAEFRRVLQPGGWLILSDIYARSSEGLEALRRLPIDSCLCGAAPQQDVIAQVEAHGFAIKHWEDHTDALKVFTARLIWSHGSIQQFWCRATSQADVADVQEAIARSRPGYYLLIGQKTQSLFP